MFGTVPLTILGFAPSIFQVKAGLRTLIPMEQKYIEEEPRVSKQVLHHLKKKKKKDSYLLYEPLFFNLLHADHCFTVTSQSNKPGKIYEKKNKTTNVL